MPSSGLLALLDDISTLLDDVATMTKVASQKTAAVIGDDLALNAGQVVGLSAARELPVVATIAKGSLVNKAILIPLAIAITAFLPSLIVPLLMIGGAFLCYEGAAKVVEKLFSSPSKAASALPEDLDPAKLERERIKGAILTDFILSAEILIIALGASKDASLLVQSLTMLSIGIGMTVLVYGTVALIVKADDVGLKLCMSKKKFLRVVGKIILWSAPRFLRLLGILGTAAMFLVGGEILAHGIGPVERAIEEFSHAGADAIGVAPGLTGVVLSSFALLLFGFFLGVCVLVVKKTLLRIVVFFRALFSESRDAKAS